MSISPERPRRQWRRVNGASPCSVCGHADWCAVSSDGTLAMCMRVEAGAFKTGTSKDGSTYFLHRLSGGPRPAAELPQQPAGGAKRATADTLGAVHQALLGQLRLSDAHR